MSRYLVALDGSEGSRAAADAVRRIAAKDSDVVLFSALHVPTEIPERSGKSVPWRWPGNPEPGPGPRLVENRAQAMDRLREETLTRLQTLAADLRAEGFRATADMSFGEAVDEILRAAERHNADVVVVATHGHTGLRATVLGSVASELIRARRFPVLVAPLHAR